MLRLTLVLLLAGCASTPSLKPQPPLVQCQQAPTPRTPPAPREDAWLQETADGVRLSPEAAGWILAVLGLRDQDRAVRAQEHACLDASEAAGHIRQ